MVDTYRLHAQITGRVQGVGFRMFAQSVALPLGVSGFVRNEPDGSVKVEAQGTRDALEALLARLRQGPPGSWISDVSTDWEPVDTLPEQQRFEIH